MQRVLHNPFNNRFIDVGHEIIVNDGLKRLADGLTSDTSFLPPTFLSHHKGALTDSAPLASPVHPHDYSHDRPGSISRGEIEKHQPSDARSGLIASVGVRISRSQV
uniref:Uncharacterized protein n=1 Tax=Haptolina brevifila TaxID=156173 RepID=A0A7S2JJP6_9EUKA|mmetsp:Transcript_84241/g.168177  ORF Transcript_84241/g.168177 Transcript_84241/m.168177 type:complete len:106 (+) Transcript_84241:63-380(+)